MSAFKPLPGAQLNLDHPLSQGLVGCWLLNENSGNLVHDYSGQGNVGTLSGFNDPPIATSGWNAGPHGGALAFDGANDFINISDNSTIEPTEAITLIAWVNPISLPEFNQVGIMSKVSGADGYILEFRNLVARVVLNSNWNGAGDVKGDVLISIGQLHFIVATYNKSTLKLYIDGKLDKSQNYSTSIVINNEPLKIGYRSAYINGVFSSVSIYNRALSAEEIAFLYAFPYCMFDEPAYPAWMRKHISAQDYYRNLLAGSGY